MGLASLFGVVVLGTRMRNLGNFYALKAAKEQQGIEIERESTYFSELVQAKLRINPIAF